jgi:hypothetical protein
VYCHSKTTPTQAGLRVRKRGETNMGSENWRGFEDDLCDACHTLYEQTDGECLISELCERCKAKLVNWTIGMLGEEGSANFLRILDERKRGHDPR